MFNALIDLTGKRFGRLVVIERADDKFTISGYKRKRWLCKCDCGNEIITDGQSLKQGTTKSCGCLAKEQALINGHNRFGKQVKTNEYEFIDDYVVMRASNKDVKFYIDAEDFELIKNYCWFVTEDNYIRGVVQGKSLRLHRFIMNINDDEVLIDHIDGNRLDNRKKNLRVVNRHQNAMNAGLPKNNSTGYKGVNKRQNGRYQAYITYNYKKIYLGTYDTPEEAYEARKAAEIKYFGEYRRVT